MQTMHPVLKCVERTSRIILSVCGANVYINFVSGFMPAEQKTNKLGLYTNRCIQLQVVIIGVCVCVLAASISFCVVGFIGFIFWIIAITFELMCK